MTLCWLAWPVATRSQPAPARPDSIQAGGGPSATSPASAHDPAAAPADSTRARERRTPPTFTSHHWLRDVWEPYAPTIMDELSWRSAWLPQTDGGLGAAAMILGEASTSPVPEFQRDGVPLGTGHILADDPWLVSNELSLLERSETGFDLASGADGFVVLRTEDPNPRAAVSRYRGTKGKHESFQRGFSLRTPRAAWRGGFFFDESLDKEAYNFTSEAEDIFRQEVDFPGHSRLRNARAQLTRNLTSDAFLTLQYTTARKTKDSLPALTADHQEIWDAGTAATMVNRSGDWAWRTVLYRNSRDVRWGDRPGSSGPAADARLLETTRSGLNLSLVPLKTVRSDSGQVVKTDAPDFDAPAGTRFDLRLDRWVVRDSGAEWLDATPWAGAGTQGRLTLGVGRTLWQGSSLNAALNGAFLQGDDGGPFRGGYGGELSLMDNRRGLEMRLTRGGRLPRSDELLTPLRRDVDGRRLTILPNPDLDLEQLTRLQVVASRRLLGLDLALDGSARWLRHGICWRNSEEQPYQGQWRNDLAMASTRLTGSVGRQGRFLGWARVRLEGTWQDTEETEGTAPILLPEQMVRLALLWENHFFQEDGILQIALYSTRRTEMPDPWDLTRATVLPAATWHDLLVGFRLVGADLGLAIRNLTDQRIRLSSAAWSHGREIEMRLRWTFLY